MLVEMVQTAEPNKLGLTVVDHKKHWEHKSRRGRVIAVGPSVRDVALGEVVIVPGHAGFTLDGCEAGYGEGYRWLKESEIDAVEIS